MVTFLVAVVTVAVVAGILAKITTPPGGGGVGARAAVELHRAQRRLETGVMRAQMTADAARLRRELDEELRNQR